uniref:Stress-induced-phosphoprotein 1 n=1 Tax=Schistosoma japonicum TaxID=6182 RepID=C1L8Z8_SCHJA|nr:putative Stress-induced-phosphoprotein 1 [Schistosoma japonicum]
MGQHEAEAEKEKGNAAHKKKDFETAIAHYDKAIELDPTCITYYTNKAAVYYEKGDFDQCVEICDKAVEIGRENRADFKLIAKAYARAAHAFEKKEDYANAKKYYDKSLSESRQPDVEKSARALEKLIKEKERLAYIDPEKAEIEKAKGNEFFQNGDYPAAIKHYSEAIKRNPSDAKLYSNRAACYTKLMEFPLAISDCNTCIELDPKFVKGYLRKGAVCNTMKDFNQARKAFREALKLDPDCSEAREGLTQSYVNDDDPEAARKHAMNDPEILSILSDPAMHVILDQMSDPTALREHLSNPDVASKLRKLIDAGLISYR